MWHFLWKIDYQTGPEDSNTSPRTKHQPEPNMTRKDCYQPKPNGTIAPVTIFTSQFYEKINCFMKFFLIASICTYVIRCILKRFIWRDKMRLPQPFKFHYHFKFHCCKYCSLWRAVEDHILKYLIRPCRKIIHVLVLLLKKYFIS